MSQNSEVILIEDSYYDAELITTILQSKNLAKDVVWFKDGEEALRSLQTGSLMNHNPRLILLDLKLPKIEGVEVLKEIKAHQQGKSIPVVVFTSSNQERDRVSSYMSGANSYVVKPIDYEAFQTAIEEVGMYWLFRNITHE